MSKDAYWFQHDSNAKDDPKCILLIEELGLEGYGIFWVLIETLRDQKNFRASFRIVPGLARRYNTSVEKIKAVITRYELFEIMGDEFFFSPSLDQRMEFLLAKKHNKKIAGIKGNLIKYGYAKKEDLDGMTDGQILALNAQKTGNSHSDRNPIALQDRTEQNSTVQDSTINGCRIPEDLLEDDIQETYSKYIEYILQKFRMNVTSIETSEHFRKLIELKRKGDDPVKVIRQTIMSGNKTLYALLENKFEGNNKQGGKNGTNKHTKGDEHAEYLLGETN